MTALPDSAHAPQERGRGEQPFLRDKLIDQADGLALIAESSEAIAAHFRPRFDAYWQDGHLIDADMALRLRFYVLDKEREAKQWRREEADLREAAEALPHSGGVHV